MSAGGDGSTSAVAGGVDCLVANLQALPSATRTAVMSDRGRPVRTHVDGTCAIRAADGTWVPVHGVDAPAAAARLVDRWRTSPVPVPVVMAIGIGLGHLLEAIEAAQATIHVVAIEPVPAVARALLARRDWTAWLNGRLTLLVGPEYAGAVDAWRAIDPAAPDPPAFVLPALDRACPELVGPAAMLAQQIVAGARANAEARRQFAGRYLTQTLQNLAVIASEGDAAALTGQLVGRPAIVVGAGPSLDRRLDLVGLSADDAVVIAVDTATRPLRAAGIDPHLVVGVDPSDTNARHLQDLGDVDRLFLVAEPSLHPSVFAPFAGRTFTFTVGTHHPWPWLRDHGLGRGVLQAWGSVLTTAFDLACVAGCNPIVFVGADLAYSRGLQYCRNTTYEPLWRDCADDAARAARFADYLATHAHSLSADVNGREVVTAPHFLQFRDWIVERARTWVESGSGRVVMNASGEGILHGGPIAAVDPASARQAVAQARPTGGRDVRAVLASLHRRSRTPATSGALSPDLDRPEVWPRDDWAAFASGSHTRIEIEEAARAGRVAVAPHVREWRYLAAVRAQWDALESRGDAERAVHPDYRFAEAQAVAQAAHAVEIHAARQGTRTTRSSAARLRALDVGCGLGRVMRALIALGADVDGADLSATMLSLAAGDPVLADCRFFQTRGDDCGEAPDGAYDLVTMIHAFQRVGPRPVRRRLLGAMSRTLRPDGVVYLQLPFRPDRSPDAVPAPHVPWNDADRAIEPTGEVWVTPVDLPIVLADVAEHFVDVGLQIVDFPVATPRFGDVSAERRSHLIVTAARSASLARRVYALADADLP
jgi:SAM-dependent methyltransferase